MIDIYIKIFLNFIKVTEEDEDDPGSFNDRSINDLFKKKP